MRVSRCRYLGLAGSSYYLSFSEIRPPDRANRHFAGYRTNVVHFWQIAKISYQALNSNHKYRLPCIIGPQPNWVCFVIRDL